MTEKESVNGAPELARDDGEICDGLAGGGKAGMDRDKLCLRGGWGCETDRPRVKSSLVSDDVVGGKNPPACDSVVEPMVDGDEGE